MLFIELFQNISYIQLIIRGMLWCSLLIKITATTITVAMGSSMCDDACGDHELYNVHLQYMRRIGNTWIN